MVIKLESVARQGQSVLIGFSVEGSVDGQVYTHAFDGPTLFGLTLAQRRAFVIATARQLLIPADPPAVGLNLGDKIDIGV